MSQRCLWQLAWHAGLFGSLITEGRPEAMDYALERLQDTEHMLRGDCIDRHGPDGLAVVNVILHLTRCLGVHQLDSRALK